LGTVIGCPLQHGTQKSVVVQALPVLESQHENRDVDPVPDHWHPHPEGGGMLTLQQPPIPAGVPPLELEHLPVSPFGHVSMPLLQKLMALQTLHDGGTGPPPA